jgi:hypothetical protein
MDSTADLEARSRSRALLFDELRRRLEEVRSLSRAMRTALARADAAGIEGACARLETIHLEVKLLAEEHGRLGPGGDEGPEEALARRAFEQEAAELARAGAVSAALAERIAGLRRGLLAIASAAAGSGGYRPGGDPVPSGQGPARWRSTL